MGTSIKTAMGFFGKGNWLSKALTILMTAVSLAFFAIASMGYTYDQLDYLTKSYRRLLQREPYLVFHVESAVFTSDLVDLVRKETAVDYFSAFSSLFFVQDYIYDYSPFRPGDTPAAEILQSFYNSPFVAGSEALMDEMGFDVVAGRRPEGPNETMISLDVFEAFHVAGFKGRADDGAPQREEIAAYSDILGKSVLISGKTDMRVFIVGVFDNTKAKKLDDRWHYPGPMNNVGNAKFVFASSFLDELRAIGHSGVAYLFAPVNDEILKPKKVESYIRVSEELLRLNEDFLRSTFGEENFDLYLYRYMFGAYDYSASLGHYTQASAGGMYMVDFYVMILCGVGGVLLVMAVIFNTYLITDTMYRARRQIGFLRSLGYKKGKIAKIILISALGLALLTFLVALLVTVSLYYGWFRALVTSGDGVLFEFSIWTVLILFGTSLLIPLISSVVPLLLFFKRPIVENIKDLQIKVK